MNNALQYKAIDSFEIWNDILVEAITKHMNMYEDSNSKAWFINDLNIRHSIEREMYFNFVHNYKYFFDLVNKKEVPILKKFKSDILKLMIGRDIEIGKVYSSKSSDLYRKKNFISNKNTILVSIVTLKFLKYCENVLDRLSYDFTLLCHTMDDEFQHYLNSKGYSYIVLDSRCAGDKIPYHLKGLETANSVSVLYEVLMNICPSTVMTFEGSNVKEDVLSRLSNLLEIKTICIQQGYAPFYPITYRNMLHDKFLTWGDFFSEELRIYNPSSSIVPVGHHTLKKKERDRESIVTVSVFLQGIKYYITEKMFKEFLYFIEELAIENTQITFLIREHPSNPITGEDRKRLDIINNILFRNSNTHTLADVLLDSDLAMSISSSSLVEAIGVGVVPIFVNLAELKMYDKVHQTYPKIPMPTNLKVTREVIQNLIDHKDAFQKMKDNIFNNYKNIFSVMGDQAITNIINEIE